jgi:hypothetical protein
MVVLAVPQAVLADQAAVVETVQPGAVLEQQDKDTLVELRQL